MRSIPLVTHEAVGKAWQRIVTKNHRTARIEVSAESVSYLLTLVAADRQRRSMDLEQRRKYHFLGQQVNLFGG